MAHTGSALSMLPAPHGTPKLSTSALEAAYHTAVRCYSCSTAAASCARTCLTSCSFDEDVCMQFSPLRGRGPLVEIVVPIVLNGFCGIESVEIGGIITKAKRKIVQCAKRCSSTSPLRGVLGSPAATTCGERDGSYRDKSTSSTGHELYCSDTGVAAPSSRSDTKEPSGNSLYQELTAVRSRAFCLTDTYTVDDGWGIIVCVLKNWISLRGSSPQGARIGRYADSETYTQGMRHPPHRMGDFVRIRGRLCVKPIEGDSGVELPKDFSRAFLRVTAVCGGRDVQDEINWFAEVYSQLQSRTTVGENLLGASRYAAPLTRHRVGGSMKRSARVSV